MIDVWYSISHMKRARALVEVQWNGREFKALLWTNPDTGSLQWATYVNNELVFLPPKREAKTWLSQPDAWRPIDGKVWPDPLPKPLIGSVPRMRSSALEATAADLAREMEANRSDAQRANARGAYHSEPFSIDKLQWWKDATLIVYKPAGEIDAMMVEGRLMRAVAASQAGYGLTLESRTVGKVLADLSTAADRAFNQEDPTSSYGLRFDPLPQDHKDFDEAMRWFTELNPPHVWHKHRKPWSLNRMQKVLFYRALPVPLSFQDIGDHLSRSGERARQIYKEALERVGKIANAPKSPNVEIERVKERNREHKRQSA